MHPTQKQLNQWLRALGQSLNTELSLDADGSTCIACENDVQVFVEMPDDSPLVCLYSPMIRLPDDLQAQNTLLKYALELNLFSLETGAACLALDKRTQTLALTFAVAFESLDAESFAEALGDFIELATDISRRLTELDLRTSMSMQDLAHSTQMA